MRTGRRHGAGTRRPAVVLFDLDGVLVDTHDAEVAALLQLASELRIPVPPEGFGELVAGRRMRDSVAIVASYSDRPLPAGAEERVRELAEGYLQDQRLLVPGVRSALRQISLPKFVVSNSPLTMIEERLERAGLSSFFPDLHFSAYECQSWKPAPGLYLKALDQLGLAAPQAVAVEDSALGVESARQAGLRVCWYRKGVAADPTWESPVRTFGLMSELPRLVLDSYAPDEVT